MHGTLSQIMVDAKDSVFIERAEQNAVELFRAGEVATEWLLHNDSRLVRETTGLTELLHHGAEQDGRDRKIKRRSMSRAERLADGLERCRIIVIAVDVAQ